MTSDAPAESYPRQQARTRGFTSGAPRLLRVSRDGARVVFVRSAGGRDPVGRLRVLDVASGTERVVADPLLLLGNHGEALSYAERSRRERMRESSAGVVGYTTDREMTRAAFALSGALYAADLIGPESARQLPVHGPVLDPRLSPNGQHIAYVRGGSLRVVGWDGSDDRSLATPEANTVTYGVADFIAAEELGRSVGTWWAPDSTAVLAERADDVDVPVWWIADPIDPGAPPRSHHYPAAGTANPRVSAHLLRLNGQRVDIRWDSGVFPYLADVSWTVHGDPLCVLLSRSQRRRLVLAVSPASGQTRVVLEDEDPCWVDAGPGRVRWAPDGRLLTITPDGDTYRLCADGTALTPAGTQVSALLDVTPDSALVLAQDDPTTAYLATISWDGVFTPLGSRLGWQSGSRGGNTLLTLTSTWSSATPVASLTRLDGSPVTLRSQAETPSITPIVTLLQSGDRSIVTAVIFPRNHVAGTKLPLLLTPYGGPHHAQATPARSFGEAQWFADQGFVVVIADGRGTPGRGPAWERAVFRDFAGPVLDDQAAAVEAVAAAYPDDVDATRVGIRGWSFGGYLAALAVLRRPDVFHAAVAGAPVTDWRLYDTAYSERYLGHPDEEPAVYQANSLIPLAARLQRPLLLMHGMTDDNVAVAHTLALSAALTGAGRPHQVLPLSGVTHMTPDAEVTENKLLLELHFLRQSLPQPGLLLDDPVT